MNPTDLIALLGRTWPRLVLFPAGVSALAVAALLIWWQYRVHNQPLVWDCQPFGSVAQLSVIALPWLGLALLPIPLASDIGRSIDVVVALACLEWPRFWWHMQQRAAVAMPDRIGRLLQIPGVVGTVLACILLALPTNSFDLPSLMAVPNRSGPMTGQIGHWFGAVLLLLVWRELRIPSDLPLFAQVGWAIRSIGLVALAALPWLAFLNEDQAWYAPAILVGVGLLAAVIDRFAQHHQQIWQRVERWCLWLGFLIVAAHAAEAIWRQLA
ncbi:MAG: hypothetical protein Fur005_03960 [Roseiflexaceae bacterium]